VSQVRLGGHGVLVVAEVVADVGQQLDEGDADVRDVALNHATRHGDGQPVEEELTEAVVVLRRDS